MGGWGQIVGFLRKERYRFVLASTAALGLVFFGLIFYLRQAAVSGSPSTYLYLEVGGTLLSFCYAANALVRFRGTHDRTALILAFGFVLSGIIETLGYFGLNDVLQAGPAALTRIPMGWMVGRTILAVLLLSAIAVERFIPTARQPSKETAGALLVVAIAAYITSAAFLAAPAAPVAHVASFISRPWDLLPGALFLIAAICFRQRLQSSKDNKSPASLYDYSLFVVASLNVVCHVSAAFSRQLFDGPFFLAELSKTASYVVMLSGALLDQARLFDQVRSMAVSDSLTGLANYRRLISVLEAELDRSRRTQRPFSVVLLDMDGLKTINDHYGHLTGSRAIVRLSKILRTHSRAIDTAARYGGDEFAVVLPEAGPDIASRVVSRIRERLAAEAEVPALSVSAGVAAFPEDGDTPEKLLGAADRALYGMKRHAGSNSVQNLTRIAACL
ncbi:MAG TPA: GGDEF domain-containing protein [Candidatus Acidoferrum sp.]|nr:GGDEF domain-containing protein [Candidatus Acidoferrum sp.]HMD39444.1 GGDEF domain-containing protein [Candidatus Acidoferrum sp.]